jgi:cell division protease FtsH
VAAQPSRSRRVVVSLIYVAIAIALINLLRMGAPRPNGTSTLAYSELINAASEGRVESVHLLDDRMRVTLRPKEGQGGATEEAIVKRLPGIDETALVEELRKKGVKITGEVEHTSLWTTIIVSTVLPLGAAIALFSWLSRKGARGPLALGKSHPRIFSLARDARERFADVAGVDEAKAELVELVAFLKDPSRYRAVGARPPRGVLLVGPPGTGKTVLARAVAGESGVPFYSLSGSEFVEMFVGVGAARVRDLFAEAKAHAPCIIFIDELDAVGKARALSGGAVGGHEEREQTLNQLLSEMDGFDTSGGVVILAATNRPEILDRALLRAGRFDRQVIVDRPDLKGREAILRVHARHIALGKTVDLGVVARRTPGMAGAELANVVNEAALAAARRNASTVESEDFELAIDRMQLGLEKQGAVLGDRERRRVAFHEAGHALVALSVPAADPVHRVTIIPRSIGALGATLQVSAEDRHLLTRTELLDRICVAMAGRAAEELALGDVSTGAENDLELASMLARQMVRRFGMSDRVGPITFARPISPYLEPMLTAPTEHSEKTAIEIDAEVRSIVQGAARRARSILERRHLTLDAIATRLEHDETLDRAELDEVVNDAEQPRAAE